MGQRIESLQAALRQQEMEFKDKIEEIRKAKDHECEREVRLVQ